MTTSLEKNSTEKTANTRSRKLPAMPFYYGDWKKDIGIQSLDFFDRGVWFELLGLMWESEERGVLILNGKPMTIEIIARVVGLDKQIFKQSYERILASGVCSIREDGAIFNRRMYREHQISQVRTEVGKLGGNPNLLGNLVNQKPNQTSEYENANENEIEDLKKKLSAMGVGSAPANELLRWIQHRKAKNKPLGPTEIDALAMEALREPSRIIREIQENIRNGNKNLYPVAEKSAQNGHGPPKRTDERPHPSRFKPDLPLENETKWKLNKLQEATAKAVSLTNSPQKKNITTTQ